MNIEDLLTEKNIYYIPKGADLLVRCLNPEHNDKNPSCRVDRVTGVFHCFSCGFKGNIYSIFGIQRDYLGERVYKLLNKIKSIKTVSKGVQIPAGSIPFNRAYRGISADTHAHFEAFTNNIEFPDRIVYPIRDITRKIVVLLGRHLYSSGRDKYYVYPEHTRIPMFPHNIDLINDSIILVEGLFDMMNLHDKGLKNAVCTFGTSTITEKSINKLATFKYRGVKKIFILFDGDKPGQRAAEDLKTLILSQSLFEVETVLLDEGIDPGDLTSGDIQLLKNTLYENTGN